MEHLPSAAEPGSPIGLDYFKISDQLQTGQKDGKKKRRVKETKQEGHLDDKYAKKHYNSPLANPHCKYISKTHHKLWQDATNPQASCMNVTPRERKNDYPAKKTGEWNRKGRGVGDRQRRKITLMDYAPCGTTL